MKRMLINATQTEELRVAIVEGEKLQDLDIETPAKDQKKANIYKGKITRIEPSLEAAFVDYGAERRGFLPFKEISPAYFNEAAVEQEGDKNTNDAGGNNESNRPTIKDYLREGQEVIVQVEREERGQKGAALSTYISLAGRYLVLMPNNPRSAGISRRIEGDERDELKSLIQQLELPDGMGLIVRTACLGKTLEDLKWDLEYLLQLWSAILQAAEVKSAPFLVYQESNLIIRAFRDYLRQDIEEVLIDDTDFHSDAKDFVDLVIPHYSERIKLYQGSIPLFTYYQIESQIETVFQHQVRLHSGGSIVIDYTEALVSIDVNSSKATKGGDIEETALNTNKEAAVEIARQLRLRDIGGLVVIDFIDMLDSENQKQVEQALREAVRIDRARVQFIRISRFGLLEMSRQRLRSSLGESTLLVCPRCSGSGRIREIESLSLSVLRLIEEEAAKERTKEIQAQLPVDVATFLLNEKRQNIIAIEKREGIPVVLIPSVHMESPNYEVKRLTRKGTEKCSYKLVSPAEEAKPYNPSAGRNSDTEKAAVRGVIPKKAAPAETSSSGILKRLWTSLFGNGHDTASSTSERTEKQGNRGRPSRKPHGQRHNNRRQRPQNNRTRRGSGQNNQNSGQRKHPRRRPQSNHNKQHNQGPRNQNQRNEQKGQQPSQNDQNQPNNPNKKMETEES